MYNIHIYFQRTIHGTLMEVKDHAWYPHNNIIKTDGRKEKEKGRGKTKYLCRDGTSDHLLASAHNSKIKRKQIEERRKRKN